MVGKWVENIEGIRAHLKSAHYARSFGNSYFYWIGGII